uniref:NADPH oxidase complex component NoxR n=1 Tax=Flammulina velutipes TaxID=38945 RepID=A0A6C0MZU7_FLAVE|nr:NADPH oxidase complex component NoxR [Flammulina velutipes]
MSLKAELETWAAALKAYDDEDFDRSLDLFSRIADSSKILTNMGLIYATLGEHEAAVEKFIEATSLDSYLAVAYFQCGVSNFLLTRYDLAYKDFEEALLYLRGNQAINYEQLGLKFRLFSAEVLFNKGLSQIYMGRLEAGLADMKEATRDKATEEHNVIDDAIQDGGEGYTVFSIPVGVLYRPSEKKLKNANAKDYMGKAKLIAASDPGDAFTTFTGVTRLKQGISPQGVFIDSPGLNRAVTAPPTNSLLPKPDDMGGLPNLARSKTTLNVPSNARELTSPGPPAVTVTRSNTTINVGRPPAPPSSTGQPIRGLSIRRPGGGGSDPTTPVDRTASPAATPQLKAQQTGSQNTRMTEFYDSYLDSYAEAPLPPPPPAPDRVAAWANKSANPLQRSGSRSAPASNYAPSSFGGGSMRRKLTRRGTSSRQQRVASAYEEEEEGYVSGEYDDGPFELVKIRLHYGDEVRGMALTPETPFDEFLDKVTTKFGIALNLKFKDEDGGKVSLRDDSDYDLAIETARESSKGKPEGKLEIWCTDI